MRRFIWPFFLFFMILAGCGGGNSPNSDAPSPVNAHEATWVTYHRDPLLDFSDPRVVRGPNGELLMDGILVKEHVTQCQVCHGVNLMGAKEGGAGPACLDCHVLDPIKYPVMCYSCHGGWPIVPVQQLYTSAAGRNTLIQNGWPVQPLQQWFSTSRAKRGGMPIDPAFINRVRTTSIHLKHGAVKVLPYDATLDNNSLSRNDDCRVCHGGSGEGLGSKHHTRLGKTITFIGQTVTISGCLAPVASGGGCHTLVPGGGGGFTLFADCVGCHTDIAAAHP